MLWLLVLAQSTAPIATNMAGLFRADDTPEGIMPANVSLGVKAALTITPEGKIQGCRVEVSSRVPKLDAHTCNLLRRRAKFRPARDSSGAPTYGVYRTQVDWWVGDGYPPTPRTLPDLAVTLSALPPKTKSPSSLQLMFRVDEYGRPSDCSLGDKKKADPTLVKLGCEQIIKTFTTAPARTAAGAPVASVQTALVQFEAN